MEIEIGEIVIENEIKIGAIEMDILKIYPEAEALEIMPTEEKQNFNGVYKDVIVKPIPEQYVIPRVEENTLILSRGIIERGVLTL